MEKEELIALLEKLPPKTEVFVRAGSYRDDAYAPVLKVFEYQKRTISAYLDIQRGTHRNYPEGYSGAREITAEILK